MKEYAEEIAVNSVVICVFGAIHSEFCEFAHFSRYYIYDNIANLFGIMAKRFVKCGVRNKNHDTRQKSTADELRDTIDFLAYRNNRLFAHVQNLSAENFVLKQRADELAHENIALRNRIAVLEMRENN